MRPVESIRTQPMRFESSSYALELLPNYAGVVIDGTAIVPWHMVQEIVVEKEKTKK